MPKPGMPPVRAVVGAVAIAALVMPLVASCAPGSTADPPATRTPAAVGTDISTAGNVTLTVWDQEVRGGQHDQMERLNAAFQAEYPNVKIDRVSRSFPDLQKTLKLALSGDEPPDVVQANQGYAAMAAFVKAGMLTSLDAYDRAYGWRKRYPKALIDMNSVTADGTSIGTGSLYGVSLNGEIVGIFYNKDKLDRLGLRPPATWAEFEQALATAKADGELPIAFGNLDKFPAIHNFGVLQDQAAGKDAVRRLVFGQGGSWTDAPTLQAAQKLSDWVRRGYLTADANAVKYDDSPVNFANGQGVFLIGGTWFAADLDKSMGEEVGFMLPPPARPGGPAITMGGESLPFAITSKSRHPDVAAAYINFISSPEAMDVAVETGVLPAIRPASKRPASPLQQEVFAAWDSIGKADGLTPYLDHATPTFPDTLGGALQELIAGRASAREAMDRAQRDYADFLATR